MGLIFSDNLLNFFGFGRGKDAFTQTKIYPIRHIDLTKGEQLVNVNPKNLYHLYQTTSHLRTIIDTKATLKSFGRWRDCELKNGKKSYVENSEFVQFMENPNPLQNGNEFIRQLSIAYDIYGNAICNVVDSEFKLIQTPPKAMWLLPTQFVTIERTGDIYKTTLIEEIIKQYRVYHTDKVYDTYQTKDILHIKNSNPDDPVLGTSKIESNQLQISNIKGALGFRNRIISSNSMLGILSSGSNDGLAKSLDADAQKQLNASMKSTFGMQEDKSDLLMTEANVKYQATAYPTKDLMLFEEIDQDFSALIDSFGLNPSMFAFQKQSTFNNVKEGFKMALQTTVIPESEELAMAVTKRLGMDGKTRWMELDYSHLEILKEDKMVNAEVLKMNIETAEKLRIMGKTKESDTLINECFEG